MDQYIGKILDNRYEILERHRGRAAWRWSTRPTATASTALWPSRSSRATWRQNAEFRRRFHEESQAVAMLSHPNIVSVYDVSKRSDDLDYIVMELIDGITLKQYMEQAGPLELAGVAAFHHPDHAGH